MSTVRWQPPAGIGADPVAAWLCDAARTLVPRLGAREHTIVHAVANAMADDLVVHGTPPLELAASATRAELCLSTIDGRTFAERATAPLAPPLEEIRRLTSQLRVQRMPGRTACALTATIPLRGRRVRTPWSRLPRLRRGRP